LTLPTTLPVHLHTATYRFPTFSTPSPPRLHIHYTTYRDIHSTTVSITILPFIPTPHLVLRYSTPPLPPVRYGYRYVLLRTHHPLGGILRCLQYRIHSTGLMHYLPLPAVYVPGRFYTSHWTPGLPYCLHFTTPSYLHTLHLVVSLCRTRCHRLAVRSDACRYTYRTTYHRPHRLRFVSTLHTAFIVSRFVTRYASVPVRPALHTCGVYYSCRVRCAYILFPHTFYGSTRFILRFCSVVHLLPRWAWHLLLHTFTCSRTYTPRAITLRCDTTYHQRLPVPMRYCLRVLPFYLIRAVRIRYTILYAPVTCTLLLRYRFILHIFYVTLLPTVYRHLLFTVVPFGGIPYHRQLIYLPPTTIHCVIGTFCYLHLHSTTGTLLLPFCFLPLLILGVISASSLPLR